MAHYTIGCLPPIHIAWWYTNDWPFYTEQLIEVQKELVDVRWMHKRDKAALNTQESHLEHLENTNKEKLERINEWVYIWKIYVIFESNEMWILQFVYTLWKNVNEPEWQYHSEWENMGFASHLKYIFFIVLEWDLHFH